MEKNNMEREEFYDYDDLFSKNLENICVEAYHAGLNKKISVSEINIIITKSSDIITEYDAAIKRFKAGQLEVIEGYEDDIDDLKGYMKKLNIKLKKLSSK